MQSVPPSYPAATTGFQFPILPPAAAAAANNMAQPQQGGVGMHSPNSPLTMFQAGIPSSFSGMTKSPTMPDFRTLHSMAPQHSNAAVLPHEYPFTVKPILPGSLQGMGGYNASTIGSLFDPFMPAQIMDPLSQARAHNAAGILPPMTIIIQPPNVQAATTTTAKNVSDISQPHLQQQQHNHVTPSSINSMVNSPPVVSHQHSPLNTFITDSHLPDTSPSAASKTAMPANFQLGNSSLPNTPTITISPGFPVLPSYVEAKQQQALQQKFASINVGKNEALIRSHSEENLQKIQKEKMELIQQNPFMGTLTNANSVPCVYVESQNMEQQQDGLDSPTNLDSPSTSASYASSPPSVRPFWMDHPNSLNEFVFHEWPLESGAVASFGGGVGGGRPGSPPQHHRSLTDLMQNPIPEMSDLDPNRGKVLHQLSLPSVAMTDLTVEEHDRNHPDSPSEFLVAPGGVDFDMEDSVMDMIKNDLHSFDMSHMLSSEAGIITQGDALLSSPEPYHRSNKK